MSLRVLSPGTYSLIVDAGRPTTRGLGVPVGGPADRISLALGNALVGNPPLAPALEIALTGPTLTTDADVGLCVFGAPFRAERDGAEMEPETTFTLQAGQTLRIGGTPSGCRAYLCVPGGLQTPVVLGSRTGLEPVKTGEVLPCNPSSLPGRGLGPDWLRGSLWLRCLPGPQSDWFDDAFFQQAYRVTPASNRMGIRLDGPPLTMPTRELVSEPVAPGAVQVTNDGRPIVLGVDGQTIGGYPKVAHVIGADLDMLGQLRPGDEVRFVRVSAEEAEAAAEKQRETLRKWVRRIALAIG
jgi:5-oxoprolinase (ATP-hydrolysing) subunit C